MEITKLCFGGRSYFSDVSFNEGTRVAKLLFHCLLCSILAFERREVETLRHVLESITLEPGSIIRWITTFMQVLEGFLQGLFLTPSYLGL